MLVGADEDFIAGYGERGQHALAELVAGPQLVLRAGRENQGIPVHGRDVQPAGCVHGRTPRCPTDALFVPQILAGLDIETLRQPRLVEQISVATDEDGRSDALWMPLR